MRIFAHRERAHPGAPITVLEADDGWRYRLWATQPARSDHPGERSGLKTGKDHAEVPTRR
jgi:hypothetical protein